MSPNPCAERFSPRATRRAGLVAAAVFLAATALAAEGVPDAAKVANAPLVEQPLAPVSNDAPGEQPTPQHVWVPGHWRWLEGAYVWESGRWDTPPAPNVAWTPPRWEQQGNGYVLREGFWDEAPPPPPAPESAPSGQQETYASQPPPPPQREIIAERPMGATAWLPGYWTWRDSRFVWVAGHWTTQPRPNARWVQPRWEMRGPSQYVFIPGYWSENAVAVPNVPVATVPPSSATVTSTPSQQVVVASPAPPQQVVVVQAPPPPRQEIVYARPSSYHVWVPGYWAWRGRHYVWVAGHYELPPRGYRHWENPRWERRGGNYIFIEGHWGR